MRKIFPSNLLIRIISLFLLILITQTQTLAASSTNTILALQDKIKQSVSGNISFTYHQGSNRVSFLIVNSGSAIAQPYNGAISSEAETTAINFLTEYAGLFGTNYKPEYTMLRHNTPDQRHVIKLRQTFSGIPVFAGEMVVRMNSSLQVIGVNGEVTSNLSSLTTKPRISKAKAQQEALTLVSKNTQIDVSTLESSTPSLWIYNPSLTGNGLDQNKLVWRMEVTNTIDDSIRELVMVDASTGNIALHINQITHAKNRSIYDNQNTPNSTLPGTPAITEGGSSPIQEVMNAYNYSGDTYDFYFTHHQRDSLNNAGMTMISTVRHCRAGKPCPYQNAYWNGTQMVYGDGFSAADDVVGHELTHAVTEFTSALIYANQSGAINESLSDVWGEFVDLTNSSGTDTADVRWQMGEDVAGIGSLRNMAAPELFDDPDKITSPNYYCGAGDNGGVHTNSGVNNKAAYLMADGDTFNNITVAGIGITKTAKIYYEAQTNILTSGSTYKDLYSALQVACTTLIGTDGITSGNCNSVKDALDAVEMSIPPCAIPPAPVCPVGTTANNILIDGLETGLGSWTHTVNQGIDAWSLATTNPYSGTNHLHGNDIDSISDSYIKNNSSIILPANAYMHFEHYYDFEESWDGGVIEYTTDNGATWVDAGSLIINNGYTGTLSSNYNNPLGGREAFVANSMGEYTSSRLDLSSLSGQGFKFRFRIGTDSSIGYPGWDIDNVKIYTCGITHSPEITSPAPGTTLPGTTETFTWDSDGEVVQQWWLYAGSTDGAYDYFVGGNGASYDVTATNLPADGSTVYIEIWYQVAGNWFQIKTTYTAANIVMTSPTPNTTLSGPTETFVWNANGAIIQQWWLFAGSSEDSYDYFVGGNGASTNVTVTGLPTDGSTVYIHIWYQINGTWAKISSTYTAANIAMSSPVQWSTLAGNSETFTWNIAGATVNQWWLSAGSSAGASDYASVEGGGASSSAFVTSLPNNGSIIYIRIWFQLANGAWTSLDAAYIAATN